MDSQIGFPPWTSTGIFLWTGLCCRSWELLLERSSSMYSYGMPFSFKAHITRQLNGLAHVPCSFTSSPMFERASNVVAIQLTMWFYNEQFSRLAWAISFVASNFFEVLQLQLKNWWLKSKEVCVSAYFPVSLHFCYFIYIYIYIYIYWWCRNTHQWGTRSLRSNNRCLKIRKYKEKPSKGGPVWSRPNTLRRLSQKMFFQL